MSVFKPWSQRTLRFRLALWYSLGSSFLLALFSATIYLFVAQRMGQPLDAHLRRDIAAVEQRLSLSLEGKLLWDGKELLSPGTWTEEDPWFELWDEEGELVVRRWPLDESELERLPSAPARGREVISIFSVAPQLRLRVLSVPFHPSGEDKIWMMRVIRMHKSAADALSALLLIIVVALPIVVALLVYGGYVITRRWLSPLDRLVEATTKIGAGNLTSRLPVVNEYDEIGRVATSFNATLARLEDAFATLDRFVADASHELRTPLTTLRSVGEVALSRARNVDEYRETIGSMLEECRRLQLLVERLLDLARAEGGAQPLEWTRVPLHNLMASWVEDLQVLAEETDHPIELALEPCEIATDVVLLQQAVQNLIDNAIKHSPPGTPIRVALKYSAGIYTISVADRGPGVDPGHHAMLTERFFRADASRSRKGGGYGLGLAITKAYVRLLNGTLAYEPNLPTGSVFTITLHPQHAAESSESALAKRENRAVLPV